MRIVVIGGTGRIGSQVVRTLTQQGHECVAAAPDTGVNTLTGQGLAEALRGAQVVVDVSNAPSWEEQAVMQFFTASAGNLIKFAKAAGVGHLVALSVVGTDRMSESAYFRAKNAQESLIRQSGLPYTIVHATQFFEFTKSIADISTHGQEIRLPSVLYQPMAAADVAAAVARAALGSPLNGMIEVGGPEKFRLDELVRLYLSATGDARQVIADPQAPYYGIRVNERTLVPEDSARLGTIRFRDWLADEKRKQRAA